MIDKNTSKQETIAAHFPKNSSTPTTIPKKIGPYPVDAYFAKGGMSHLYLATNTVTNQPLIIKVLPESYISFPQMTKRFLKEAKIIAKTDHPNIVKLIDQGNWQNGLFIAMEFIRGVSLKKIISQNTFSLEKSLQIILQIASAVSHLHAHGIIHRDLKPENILLSEDGMVKVIDFGIALMHNEKIDLEKIEGTALYMAPEQREKKKIDFRADIYSLGIIAYELITGKPAYGIVQLKKVPSPLRPLLAKALAVDPNERYKDIVDFIHGLKSALDTDLSKSSDEPTRFLEALQKAQVALNHFPTMSQFFEMAMSHHNEMESTFFDCSQIEDETIFVTLSSLSDSINQYVYTNHLAGFYKAHLQEMKKKDLPRLIEKMDRFSREMKQTFAATFVSINPHTSQMQLCTFGPAFIFRENQEFEALSSNVQPLGAENLTSIRMQSNHLWEEETLQCVQFSSPASEKLVQSIEGIIQTSRSIAFTHRPSSISEALFEQEQWSQNKTFVFFLRKTL